jgi:serine/threonine-protein kinase
MAPEQVRARPLDKRADVFALGVILYELTTGTRLYRGSDVQVMTAIVEEDAPPPTARIPDYPQDLEEIVLAALSRDRSKRLPSAAHLAFALEEFALQNGMVIGHNTVARYAHTVFPYEREQEQDLALVQDEPELGEVHDHRERGGAGAEWPEDHVDIDESGIMRDLDLLSPENLRSHDQTGAHLRSGPESLPPEMLEDILFEDITEDEMGAPSGRPEPLEGFDDASGDRPVVLLDSPKRPREHDFVDDLARRLEDEDET